MAKIDRSTAEKIAEAMNTWAGKEHRMQIITADMVLNLSPIAKHEPNGYDVYAYQWGDVTILACQCCDGRILIRTASW